MSFAELAAQLAEIGRQCHARGTTTGTKTAPESYAKIAAALERSPSEVSDITAELDAALTAGMQTALCVRTPGSGPSTGRHLVIHVLDRLFKN